MNFEELVKNLEPYKRALSIDALLSRSTRWVLRNLILVILLCSFIFSLYDYKDVLYGSLPDGVFLISLALLLTSISIESFYNSSRYFYQANNFEFALAQVVFGSDEFDMTAGLINSDPGRKIFSRLGVNHTNLENFLSSTRDKIIFSSIVVDQLATIGGYARTLYQEDFALQQFLAALEVSREDFVGTADWVGGELQELEISNAWWSASNLDKAPSIGSALSYGNTYDASKYSHSISSVYNLESIDVYTPYRYKELDSLELALTKSSKSNAIIITEEESVALDIIARLAKRINLGISSSALEHKHILVLNWQLLISENNSTNLLTRELVKIVYECASAGNVILFIANFSTFISEGKKLGVDIQNLLGNLLSAPQVHIIAQSNKNDFYYFIENNVALASNFERLVPDEEDSTSSMPPLLELSKSLEYLYRGKIFFTYPSVREVSQLAERFIAFGEMPGKALEMLRDVALWAMRNGIKVLLKGDVATFIALKAGVPTGAVSASESTKLQMLENILHERIVGQDIAVKEVSGAMRRARTGISNPKRPVASFLFLGPTGVGKTGTAKALAESYFGSEERMIRFDMNEYSGPDALPRLIGNIGNNHAGTLTTTLRDNPYGVVLLDEFEKAAPDVRNLFLPILDEGKFADAFGTEINARNSIIIATSNAGAEKIWEMLRNNENLDNKKSEMMDYLVESNSFKPELLNRFDAIVIYKPLESSELRLVAEKLFEKFANRLKEEKQIDITASPELIDYLVLHGAKREFGARSLERILEEKVENALARKVLSGQIKAGDKFEMGVKDVL